MNTVNKLNEVLQTVQAILAFQDNYVRPKKISKEVHDFAGSMKGDVDMLLRVIHQNLHMVTELKRLEITLQMMIDESQVSAPNSHSDDKPPSDLPEYWSFMSELSMKAYVDGELKKKTNEAPGFTFLDGTELIDQSLRKHLMERIDTMVKTQTNESELEFTVVCHPDTAVKLWGKPKGCKWGNYVPTQQGKPVHSVVIVVSDDERMSKKEVFVYAREKGHSEPEPMQYGSFDFQSLMKSSTDARAEAKAKKTAEDVATMVQTHRPTHTAIRGYPTYAVSPSEPGRIIKVQGFFRTPYSVYAPDGKKIAQVYRHLYRMVAGTCSTISDPTYDDLYELYVRFVLKTEMYRQGTKINSGFIHPHPTGTVLYPTSISRGIKLTDVSQTRRDILMKLFEELRSA